MGQAISQLSVTEERLARAVQLEPIYGHKALPRQRRLFVHDAAYNAW